MEVAVTPTPSVADFDGRPIVVDDTPALLMPEPHAARPRARTNTPTTPKVPDRRGRAAREFLIGCSLVARNSQTLARRRAGYSSKLRRSEDEPAGGVELRAPALGIDE